VAALAVYPSDVPMLNDRFGEPLGSINVPPPGQIRSNTVSYRVLPNRRKQAQFRLISHKA
jgi:hypothetical protein